MIEKFKALTVTFHPALSDPGGHSLSELEQHPQMTGKGRVVVSAMSTEQDGGRGLREINIAQ